jgi:hypothetical protein
LGASRLRRRNLSRCVTNLEIAKTPVSLVPA